MLNFDMNFGSVEEFNQNWFGEEEYEGLTDDDEIPEEVETRCKPGDLWLLGKHRLLCGDATDADAVERLMDGEKADMVFTDPPYNVGIDYTEKTNDSKTDGNYIQWSKDWFFLLKETVSENIAFTPGAFNLWFWYGIEKPKWVAIWVKKNQQSRNGAGGFNAYEPILIYGKIKIPFDVFDVPIAQQDDVGDHPVPKLFNAWNKILDSICVGKIIIDPFLGSGTTLIACEKTSRICYGMEIDPHYCDVIIQRWENYTGETAELANG
jgi:DNA modification methylase